MKKSILPLIFLVLSIGSYFIFSGFVLCISFAILAIIASIIGIKSKEVLIYIALVVSICMLGYYVYNFNSSEKVVDDIISDAKIEAYRRNGEMLENYLEMYFYEHAYEDSKTYIVTDTEIAEKTDYVVSKECKGYVVATPSNKEYKGYVSCGKYTSDGYDEEIYKSSVNALD